MSTYKRETKHPVTGEWENATWFDDFFGFHHYGVVFPSDEATVDISPQKEAESFGDWMERAKHIAYDPEKIELETRDN